MLFTVKNISVFIVKGKWYNTIIRKVMGSVDAGSHFYGSLKPVNLTTDQ